MKLLAARFKNYSVLHDVEFRFDENPYIWTAPNESGKSTLIMGIRDAFLLNPAKLKGKRTLQRSHDPVIELEFSINGNKYYLKVNAQDDSVVLTGDDGLNLEKKDNILKFLEDRGYSYFPSVLEHLLIFRERDLAVSSMYFRELLDSLFKTANTEDLKRVIDGFLKVRGSEYFKDSLGKAEKEARKKYGNVKKDYMNVIEEHLAYRENRRKLEESRKEFAEIGKKIREVEASVNELSNKKILVKWRKIQVERDNLNKEVSGLEREINELKNRMEKVDDSIKECEEKLRELTRGINELMAEAGKIKGLKKELEYLNRKIEIHRKIADIEGKLGKWSDANIKTLEKELEKWRAFELLSKESEGIIRIIQAEDRVFVNEVECKKEVSFKGSAKIKYRDLELDVYSRRDIAEQEAEIEEYKEKYSNRKNLEGIISLLRERDSIKRTLADNEAADELEELKSRVENEISKASLAENKINERRREQVSLEKELNRLKKQKDELARELSKKEGRRNYLLEKCTEKERELKSIESDNISGISIRDFDNIYRKSQSELRELVEQIEREIEEKSDELKRLEREKGKLEGNIRYYEGLTSKKPDEDRLEQLLREMQGLDVKLRNFEKAARVLHYGRVVLEKLIKEVNNKYLKSFEDETGKIFQSITGGRYTEVDFAGDSLIFSQDEFRKGWRIRGSNAEFEADHLSDGAFSQLLLSARLALIKMFFNENRAFLFFDEPFAYFDREREKNAMKLLRNLASSGWQIIIVSAKDVNT